MFNIFSFSQKKTFFILLNVILTSYMNNNVFEKYRNY